MFMQRINDMRTIKSLCLGAESHANADGQQAPGLEHFVLAALDLPDGTARKAFERIGANPDAFPQAIADQYEKALKGIGIDAPQPPSMQHGADGISPGKGLYQSKPQVQAFMQQLANRKKTDAGVPLLGAHVIEVIAAFEHGVASRTLALMGIDRQRLIEAAQMEAGEVRGDALAG
jgi:ATP-dependent Clp protease ATP-binding subunit ClpA